MTPPLNHHQSGAGIIHNGKVYRGYGCLAPIVALMLITWILR